MYLLIIQQIFQLFHLKLRHPSSPTQTVKNGVEKGEIIILFLYNLEIL